MGPAARTPLPTPAAPEDDRPPKRRRTAQPTLLACFGTAARGSRAPTSTPAPTRAVIYEWAFAPPFDHPLKGAVYVGQTYQTLEARTAQHKRDAAREPRELGLHALWSRYPHDDHWDVRAVATRDFADRVEAIAWMNAREVDRIAAHGGVLRDMDAARRQTLNLTKGGQGDPRAVWAAVQARSRRALGRVWPALKAYHAAHDHLRVPFRHRGDVEGVHLGKLVSNIRSQQAFLQHADFVAWLDARGFAYDAPRARLVEAVWPALKAYHAAHGHLRVPQRHRGDVEDVHLGQVVGSIRSQQAFLQHADFVAWLDARGFAYDAPRARLEEAVWPALKAYHAAHGHLRVPQRHRGDVEGVHLGQVVGNIRSQQVFLHHADFTAWLRARGFRMHAQDERADRAAWARVGASEA